MTLNDVREILNGIWTVSAFCVFVLLVVFICIRRVGYDEWDWRWHKAGWWQDRGVQVAGALAILVFGHFLRSAPQWVQFILWNNDGEPGMLTSKSYKIATLLFVPATVLVLMGKILSVWAISPGEWNWIFAVAVLILSVLVPFLVFWTF